VPLPSYPCRRVSSDLISYCRLGLVPREVDTIHVGFADLHFLSSARDGMTIRQLANPTILVDDNRLNPTDDMRKDNEMVIPPLLLKTSFLGSEFATF
jgi:hypothetical protein